MVKQGRQEWPVMRGGQSRVLRESGSTGACKRRGFNRGGADGRRQARQPLAWFSEAKVGG